MTKSLNLVASSKKVADHGRAARWRAPSSTITAACRHHSSDHDASEGSAAKGRSHQWLRSSPKSASCSGSSPRKSSPKREERICGLRRDLGYSHDAYCHEKTATEVDDAPPIREEESGRWCLDHQVCRSEAILHDGRRRPAGGSWAPRERAGSLRHFPALSGTESHACEDFETFRPLFEQTAVNDRWGYGDIAFHHRGAKAYVATWAKSGKVRPNRPRLRRICNHREQHRRFTARCIKDEAGRRILETSAHCSRQRRRSCEARRTVTTRASYRRRVRRERFEWPLGDCIPGSPWTGGSWRFGNRLRRTFGCGSTRRLSA